MARRNNIYKPDSQEPFNVSRSKIDFFLECAQCFYLDRRFGITRPSMPGWALNSAVDYFLKNEFDALREKKQPHEIMRQYGIDATPFWHINLAQWRDDRQKVGASFLHKATNLNIHGMVDDIWQDNKTKELYIVDYKSTSTEMPISLDSKYKEGYKRQMEIYQWIFKNMGFPISPVGYFLFANAKKNHLSNFNATLKFEMSIIPYQGDNSWIEKTIFDIKQCLESSEPPSSNPNCEHCYYRNSIMKQDLKNQISLI